MMFSKFRKEKLEDVADAVSSLRNPPLLRHRWIVHNDICEGARELVILRDNSMSAEVPINTPEGDYRNKDIFVERNGYYHMLSRVDDTLVHTNGEKTNPVPMEMKLLENQLIQQAATIGHDRICTAALLQLDEGNVERRPYLEVLKEVELAVGATDKDTPRHSRILPEMIYILPLRGEMLPQSDKGSLQR
ncbi:uncharacterized protein VTP21DRAFT_6207 [Calcarisporiella thermophila]|uniref:uncharacterized protein n=1 Tax=Calcarisporiella thermophila TaxID=911321 RepID=UPI0037422A5A